MSLPFLSIPTIPLLSVLVMVATVLGVGMIVPQVNHLHRTRRSDGVSAVWVGVGAALNVWWIIYAVGAERWGLLPVSIGGTVLYLATAWLLVRIDGLEIVRPLLQGATIAAIPPAVALTSMGWEGAGVAIGMTYAVQFAPAAYTALRSLTVAGISLATWVMALIEALIWFVYGAALGDWALLIGGGGGAFMSALIVVRMFAGDRRDLGAINA